MYSIGLTSAQYVRYDRTGPRSAKGVWMEPGRLWRKEFVKQLKAKWKAEGMTDGESEVMRWYVLDVVNQEESEQDEVDGTEEEDDSTVRRWFLDNDLLLNGDKSEAIVIGTAA